MKICSIYSSLSKYRISLYAKILIVEDEKLIRESIVELLTEEGFECYQAENGRAGISAAKNICPI